MKFTPCSIIIDKATDERKEFDSIESAMHYLRTLMESDDKMYLYNITKPTRTSHKSKNASITMQWMTPLAGLPW